MPAKVGKMGVTLFSPTIVHQANMERKISKTTEQVVHQANIEWKIPRYRKWSEVSPKGAVKSSGVYAFKFDGVAETFKFELEIIPRTRSDKGDVIIKVVN